MDVLLGFEPRPQGFAGLHLNHLATSRYWWAGEVSNLHHLVLQTSATDRISYLPIIGVLIMRASQHSSALLNDFLVYRIRLWVVHPRFYVRSVIRTSTSLTKVVPRVGFEPTIYGI